MLRDYQVEAVSSIWNYFEHASGNPVVAMPTGTGKSWVIGDFVRGVVQSYASSRVLMLTHVKELIEQNFEKLMRLWPTAPAGVYSAGLGKRQVAPITYGGIASLVNSANLLGFIDLVLVDECHLVSPKGTTMYRTLIDELKAINPALKVIGFSATPYRLGQGMITDGGLFTDVCFDITGRDAFNRLIHDGWLAPLIPKRTGVQIDLAGVKIQGGEYNQQQLQAAVDRETISYYAMRELVECADKDERESWLVFTTGVEHTDHVAEMLRKEFRVEAYAVHSKMEDGERDQAIKAFKAGKIRCLVNNNVLTTGFDHPHIDLIGVLRPTASAGLWVQMLGRGTRPAEGKQNCLVLDFAGNTERLGPINDPVLPRRKGTRPGRAPVKTCDACQAYNHASVRYCVCCGAEFHRDIKFGASAGTHELIAGPKEMPQVEWFKVDRVTYSENRKANKPVSLKVSYYCGLRLFQEWVCLEHTGFALHKAHKWWRARYPYIEGTEQTCPPTVAIALGMIRDLRTPTQIQVWVNRKYPEVMNHVFV